MAISLGTQEFVGNGNFTIAMVTELATQLLGKDVTVTIQGTNVAVLQGGSMVATFDLAQGTTQPWFAIAALLLSGATSQDVHNEDRVDYVDGYTHGVDWRDMSQTTTINENRYIDPALTIGVNNTAFTMDGFGDANFTKLAAVRLRSNDGTSNDGALVEYGLGNAIIRVNSNGEVQANKALGSITEDWETFSTGAGNISLATGDNNWLLFELVERPNVDRGMEYVAVFYNGTDYFQLNDITAVRNLSLTGDDWGVSRSSSQRGQVLEFRVINSPAYLSHSALETLLRQHRNDKWDFGFARLTEGSDAKEVDLTTILNLPAGSMLGGEELVKPETIVYEATSKTATVTPGDGGLVNAVALPTGYTNFKYVHVTEYDGTTNQWRHAEFPVSILALVTTGDSVRLQGNTTMAWVSATRTLALSGGANEIYRVSLKD